MSVFQTVMKTLYWQKYGLNKRLEDPMYTSSNFKSMSSKQIFEEINKASDEFAKVICCSNPTF